MPRVQRDKKSLDRIIHSKAREREKQISCEKRMRDRQGRNEGEERERNQFAREREDPDEICFPSLLFFFMFPSSPLSLTHSSSKAITASDYDARRGCILPLEASSSSG